MMERYQIIDQPTLIRDSPTLLNQFSNTNRTARINTTNSCTNIGNMNRGANSKSTHKEDRNRVISPMPKNNFGENKGKSIY
jgi:hypothetical protein